MTAIKDADTRAVYEVPPLLLARDPGTRGIHPPRARGGRRPLHRRGCRAREPGRRRAGDIEDARRARRATPALCGPGPESRPATHRADAEHPPLPRRTAPARTAG